MSVHCVSDNDPRKNRLAIRLCQKHDIDRSTGLDLTELKSFLTHYKKEMKKNKVASTLDPGWEDGVEKPILQWTRARARPGFPPTSTG